MQKEFVYIPELRDLRSEAGVTMSMLAAHAGVSVKTIARIENLEASTYTSAIKVIQGLKRLLPQKDLDFDSLIKRQSDIEKKINSESRDVVPEVLMRGGRVFVKPAKPRVQLEFSLNEFPSPAVMVLKLGTTSSKELGVLFHEISVLYQMVGGSGLQYYFEDSREREEVTV
jgi:DNA-binding XRE family transcriptional regulator